MPGLIVIGYDGSADAAHAIDAAGRVLEADAAVVVHVWLRGLAAVEQVAPLGGLTLPLAEPDEQLEAAARDVAQEGAERARAAGLDAEPVTLNGTAAPDVGRTLATLADERGAAAIVVGRRGVLRLEAVVLGSTSNATVREARCPALVVPSPERC